MPLEETFPGFSDGIAQLRSKGFTEAEIERAVHARMSYLKKAGGSPEAVAALAQGKPSPYDIHVNFDKQGQPDILSLTRARHQLDEWHNRYNKEPDPYGYGERWLGGVVSGVMDTLRNTGQGGDLARQEQQIAETEKLSARYGIPTPKMPDLPSTTDIIAHALYENEAVKRARHGLETIWESRPRPGGGFGQIISTPAGVVAGGVEAASAVTGGIGELVRRAGTALAGPGLGTEAASMTAEFLAGHAMTPPERPAAGGTLDRPQALAQAMGEPPPPEAPPGLSPRAQLIQDFTHPEATGPTVTTRVEPGSIPGEFFRRGAPRLTTQFKPAPSAELAVADIHRFAGQDAEAQLATLRAAETTAERAPAPESVLPHDNVVTDVVEEPQRAHAEIGGEPDVPRKRGRPTTRPLDVRTGTQGISDDAARTALAGWKSNMMGLTQEEALTEVRNMSMEDVRQQVGAISKYTRIATGELTGKRGRPSVPGMPEAEAETTGSPIVDEMMPRVSRTAPEREVQLPEREVVKAPVLSLSQMRPVAASKGWDLQYDVVNTDSPIRLIANGGSEMRFKTLDALDGYLQTQDSVPVQPVELPVAETGDTTFERMITDKPLTDEHKIHLSRQKRRMEIARSRPGGLIGDDAQQPATELTEPTGVKRYELKPNQQIGSVEDIATEAAAQTEVAKIKASGLQARVIKAPNSYEVVFYRDLTTDISRQLGIHKRILQEGPLKASVAEHRDVGRAFGISDHAISEYLVDHGLTKSKGLGGRVFERLLGETLEESLPDMVGRTRIVNITAGTQNSGSPVIRMFGKNISEARIAHSAEMREWKTRLDHLQTLVPDTARAQELAEGLVKPSGEAERQFLSTWQVYRNDFATRATQQGLLKENAYIKNYATHRSDIDAVYNTIRSEIVGAESYKDLDLQTQMMVKPEQYEKWRDAFLKSPTRDTMSRNTWDAILKTMKDWGNVASTAGDLPNFIRTNLPAHIYVKYFQPRTGGTAYLKDFYGNTADYMNDAVHALHFDPLVKKWDPMIKQLGGEGAYISERAFMEKMMNSAVFRRPSGDRLAVDFITRNINDIIGKEMLKVGDLQAGTQLLRDAFLRSTVGFALDSAFRHSTHIVSSWLANGRVTGALAKSVVKLGRVDQSDIFQEFLPLHEGTIRDLKPTAATMREFARVSGAFTKWALQPIQISENIAKGTAFLGGVEDAVRRGLSPVDTLKLGFASASEVVPDTRITEAYWAGLNSMLSSQTTLLPHLRSPYMTSGPLGRLSNVFLVWPTHMFQFANSQIRTAFAESIMRNDKARLVRWTAGLGGLATLYQSGHVTGVNWDDFFFGHAANLVTALPFYRVVTNAARAATGEPSVSTDQAKRDLVTAVKAMTPGYPAWRYGGKLQSIVENVRRGYATDQMGRRLYEIGDKKGPFYTSEFGELMRGLGLQPQAAVDGRAIAHTIAVESYKRGQAKRDAIHSLLQTGDPSGVAQFGMKYGGQGITSQDVMKELQRQNELYETRMLQRTPKGLRPQMMQQMEGLR